MKIKYTNAAIKDLENFRDKELTQVIASFDRLEKFGLDFQKHNTKKIVGEINAFSHRIGTHIRAIIAYNESEPDIILVYRVFHKRRHDDMKRIISEIKKEIVD